MGGGERRFYFELAEKLGCTVEELLARVSSKELTEWIVVWKLRAQERQAARRK